MAKRVTATGPVDGPWALPDGWRWERLGNVLPLSYGRALKATERLGGDVPVYGSAGITGFHNEALCEEPALIVGRKGSAGAVYHSACPFYAIDTAYFCARSSAKIDLRLAFHLLTFLNLRKLDQSTAVPSLSRDPYNELIVPVPPDAMQPILGARIDELFAEVDDGEAALARARDDLATWRKALLKAAVTGELTADWRAANLPNETGADLLARILGCRRARWDADVRNKGKRYKEPLAPNMDALPAIPQGWTWASFDQLVDQLSNGISAKPAHSPPGIPILRISSVRPMLVRDDQRRWLPQDFPVGGALAKQGDLLFTRYNGNPELVGVCGRYRGETPVAYPDKVMCARPSSADNAVGDFLELAMNAGSSRKHIAAYTKTSAGQHGVAGSSVKVAPVPIPPQAELEHIVQLYRDATAQAEDGWSDAIDLIAISGTVRQSILAAAFRGDLA
jgi:type I restriction enzyme S subunit